MALQTNETSTSLYPSDLRCVALYYVTASLCLERGLRLGCVDIRAGVFVRPEVTVELTQR